MEIFYIKKSEFIEVINLESLEEFSDGREYRSAEKHLEHLMGLFLVKFIAKHVFGLNDTEIILQNSKPIFKNGAIHFSISHSKDIVIVAFNKSNIGADVELMQKRDYKTIMARYNRYYENPSDEDFYHFWTRYEAEIKLGEEPVASFSVKLPDNYMLSCVSSDVLVTNFRVKKLCVKSGGLNVDLRLEFNSPQYLRLN